MCALQTMVIATSFRGSMPVFSMMRWVTILFCILPCINKCWIVFFFWAWCEYSDLCVFFQNTKHYELLNYSEHGTTVDNVLYSCDFSEKASPSPPSGLVSDVQGIIREYIFPTSPHKLINLHFSFRTFLLISTSKQHLSQIYKPHSFKQVIISKFATVDILSSRQLFCDLRVSH